MNYLVYLRRTGTTKVLWQFSTTVVAPDRATALQRAFDQWKYQPHSSAPATLAECDQKADVSL